MNFTIVATKEDRVQGLSTVLITADLHGSTAALEAILRRCEAEGASSLIIAGDLCPPDDPLFASLLQQAPSPLIVRGNCDSSYAFSRARLPLPPRILSTTIFGRTVVITHGDLEVDFGPWSLTTGDIIVVGHTHVPGLYLDEAQILTINSGSPVLPRSAFGPTYARLDATEASIHRLGDGSRCLSIALSER